MTNELVFAPLGGLGEIGMNAALYGFGSPKKKKWILVDCGLSFAGEDLPGIDIVLPDLSFIEREKHNLLGIFITHAHEDHIGALADLWPRLQAPVYATRFAAGLLSTRRLSEPGAPKIPLNVVTIGERIVLGDFSVEYIPVAHSIPESCALAIRTPLGLAVHTGDWKLDNEPVLGGKTEEAAFRKLGDEGVLALICDSTNVVRDGFSPSEGDVAKTLAELIAAAPARVAVTTFASNVARIRSVAEAAKACGREVVVVGRAMDRSIAVAAECGYMEGLTAFRAADSYGYLPRDKVVALLTGSQGEPRAALARVAANEHPDITLAKGDCVILSSRTIPGNEKPVGRIVNSLILQGVEVITDRHHLVHASGHPRKGELARMYEWIRPQIAIPAHGEPLHLSEHAAFAASMSVPHVLMARNGAMVRLAPDAAEIVADATTGQLYKDGNIVIGSGQRAIPERRKLAFAGIISVALAVNANGDSVGEPEIELMGLPDTTRDGTPMEDLVLDALDQLLSNLPKAKRRDPDGLEDAIKRSLRSAVDKAWGKKPACHVLVVEV